MYGHGLKNPRQRGGNCTGTEGISAPTGDSIYFIVIPDIHKNSFFRLVFCEKEYNSFFESFFERLAKRNVHYSIFLSSFTFDENFNLPDLCSSCAFL